MKVGDLVRTKRHQRIGFVTSIQDRHGDGQTYCFVRFTCRGNGLWYKFDKLEVISE